MTVVLNNHADTVRVLVRLIRHLDYDCAGFTDVPSTLPLLERQPPTLLILGNLMPHMTGTEVLRWMRGHDKLEHTPVVYLAGNLDARSEAERLGVTAYLLKPLNFAHLKPILRSVYARPRVPQR